MGAVSCTVLACLDMSHWFEESIGSDFPSSWTAQPSYGPLGDNWKPIAIFTVLVSQAERSGGSRNARVSVSQQDNILQRLWSDVIVRHQEISESQRLDCLLLSRSRLEDVVSKMEQERQRTSFSSKNLTIQVSRADLIPLFNDTNEIRYGDKWALTRMVACRISSFG
jgi:hypothetical protein